MFSVSCIKYAKETGYLIIMSDLLSSIAWRQCQCSLHWDIHRTALENHFSVVWWWMKTGWGKRTDSAWLGSALCVSFSVLTLLVAWQKGHPAHEGRVLDSVATSRSAVPADCWAPVMDSDNTRPVTSQFHRQILHCFHHKYVGTNCIESVFLRRSQRNFWGILGPPMQERFYQGRNKSRVYNAHCSADIIPQFLQHCWQQIAKEF